MPAQVLLPRERIDGNFLIHPMLGEHPPREGQARIPNLKSQSPRGAGDTWIASPENVAQPQISFRTEQKHGFP